MKLIPSLPRSSLLFIVLFVLIFAGFGAYNLIHSHATALTGDLNSDGTVNVFDLSIFLAHWQQTGTGIPEDFNNDGVVSIFDLSMLLSNYGQSSGGATLNCTQTISPGANLATTITNASAGSVICLNAGNYSSPIDIDSAHATATQPVTITSANPATPAVINNELTIHDPASYLTFTHLSFNWSMPTPWVCWSAGGDPISNEIISTPYSSGTCQAGTPNPGDWPQIGISGGHNSLTYDDITNQNTDICFNIVGTNAVGNVIDHDTVHDCGPLVAGYFYPVNADPGWHDHGIYDYGQNTQITNNYIYGNSRNGILLYPDGSGSVVMHNIIDGNGNGITFGGNLNATVKYNIITSSSSPLGQFDYGVDESAYSSTYNNSGSVLANNCFWNNKNGDLNLLGSSSKISQSNNLANTNPLYTNAANHNYKLQPTSPCTGYGPDTAQP